MHPTCSKYDGDEKTRFMEEFKHSFKMKIQSHFNNKKLFPDRIGPHSVYTLDHPEEKPNIYVLNQQIPKRLLKKLKQHFHKNNIKQPFNNTTTNKANYNNYSQKQQKQISTGEIIPGVKIGNKYKKYSYEFKKKIIAEIQQYIGCDIQQKLKKRNKNKQTHKTHFPKQLRTIIRRKSKQYNVHTKNIFRWTENKDLIQNQSGRKAQHPELQKQLEMFIRRNSMIKRRDIINQGRLILQKLKARDHEFMNEQQDKKQQFMFSKGWYQRFKNRIEKRNIQRSRNNNKSNNNNSIINSNRYDHPQLIKSQKQRQRQQLKNINLQKYEQIMQDSNSNNEEIQIEYDSWQEQYRDKKLNDQKIFYDQN